MLLFFSEIKLFFYNLSNKISHLCNLKKISFSLLKSTKKYFIKC